jgi:hypothetical protein
MLPAGGRPGSVMSEESESDSTQAAEARRAVERWDTEGGAQEPAPTMRRTAGIKPGSESRTESFREGLRNRPDPRAAPRPFARYAMPDGATGLVTVGADGSGEVVSTVPKTFGNPAQ